MSPIKVSLDSNDIMKMSAKYKKFKYIFLDENLLFSSNLDNDTNEIFVTCNGLSDVKEALINFKTYKTLGFAYLSEIKKWNSVEGGSKRLKVSIADSEYHTKSPHFGFTFATKNVSGLFNFTVALLDGNGNKIIFPSNRTKVPTIGFKFKLSNNVRKRCQTNFKKLVRLLTTKAKKNNQVLKI